MSAEMEGLVDVLCGECARRVPGSLETLKKLLVGKWGQMTSGQDETDGEGGNLGPLDPLTLAQQRITELELALAETKLAHVEAECQNQSLNHQLNSTMSEAEARSSGGREKGSWQPWLSKKFNTIQEKVRKDLVAGTGVGMSVTGGLLMGGNGGGGGKEEEVSNY